MTLNPEYNKILAEALVKEDERRTEMEMIPMSVIEDIRAEIKSQMDDDDYFCGLSLALQIIDKHISGKEQE